MTKIRTFGSRPPELVEEVVNMEPAILAADERFVYITQDKETYDRFWRRQLAEMDERARIKYAREEGIEQGIEQGLEQGIEQTARNLKKMGLSNTQIAEATNLSLEVIEEIKS